MAEETKNEIIDNQTDSEDNMDDLSEWKNSTTQSHDVT
jgi:hypothetical protein